MNETHLPKLALPTTPAPENASPLPTQPVAQPSLQTGAKMQMPAAGQIEIARNFLPVYPLEKGSEDMPAQLLPFFASDQLLVAHTGFTTLVIMLPDESREAARAYAYARAAQEEASRQNPQAQADKAFLFVPQFLLGEDIAGQASAFPDGGKALLRWSVMEPYAGWVTGQESSSDFVAGRVGGSPHISSFAVMDYVLLLLTDKNIFPDLKNIVIAGTGVGGVFAQLYAALGQSPDVLASEGIATRYVSADAPSFLYMDKMRAQLAPSGDYQAPDAVPAFTQVNTASCPAFNTYPFGLEARPPYAQNQGEDAVRLRYGTRAITTLVPANATQPLATTTPMACAFALQGHSLTERAKIHFAHVQRLYGDDLTRGQQLILVPTIGNDPLALWRSGEGQNALFGSGGG